MITEKGVEIMEGGKIYIFEAVCPSHEKKSCVLARFFAAVAAFFACIFAAVGDAFCFAVASVIIVAKKLRFSLRKKRFARICAYFGICVFCICALLTGIGLYGLMI